MNPLRIAAIVLGAVMVQVCLLSQFSIAGARPDLGLLVVLAAAFAFGPDDGAIVGFSTGLLLDVFLSTPFGLTAFVFTLVGFAVGSWTAGVIRSAWWLSSLAIAAASVVAVFVHALIGELLGQSMLTDSPFLTIVAVVAGANLFLAPIATTLVSWARVGDRPHRRSIFAS